MTLYLNHVNILTSDTTKSVAFYEEKLGMRLCRRHYHEDRVDIALLRDGSASSGFCIQLIGPPHVGWMKDLFSVHSGWMDHLGFEVEDLDVWRQRLEAWGVEFLFPPHEPLRGQAMYFKDACGSVVELVMPAEGGSLDVATTKSSVSDGIHYCIDHVSMLCRDIPALERFYVEGLGLKTVREARHEGFIMLVDPVVLADSRRNSPSLEIMGPPGLWERDVAFLSEHGPGLDHIGFVVEDVDTAHAELLAKGVSFDVAPVDFMANRIAFFKDPNGIEIEIMVRAGWPRSND